MSRALSKTCVVALAQDELQMETNRFSQHKGGRNIHRIGVCGRQKYWSRLPSIQDPNETKKVLRILVIRIPADAELEPTVPTRKPETLRCLRVFAEIKSLDQYACSGLTASLCFDNSCSYVDSRGVEIGEDVESSDMK